MPALLLLVAWNSSNYWTKCFSFHLEIQCLRVFLLIFDQTLTAHFLNTDDAKTNRFLLMKQLTPKVHDDSISDDNAPSSGSSELIKFKTSNAIYFCYSDPIFMTIPPFDWKLNWLSEMGFQSWNFRQKTVFCPKMVFLSVPCWFAATSVAFLFPDEHLIS